MQKKLILIALLIVASSLATAQNIQLHFDPRHSINGKHFARNYFTATFEMFKADKWGSTYMFVDLDMSEKKGNFGLAYTEISRDQNLGKLPFKAHVEFNGGLVKSGSIANAYLFGASYPFSVGAFNFNTYVAYKLQTFDRNSHDIQWTATWGANLCKDKITLSGVVDVWTANKKTEKNGTESGKKVIFITEPQFWYNVNSHLSFGSEVEITSNFCFSQKTFKSNRVFVNPTIAVKWNF